MAKTDAWESALIALLFTNANAAGIGDATGLRGSTAAGSLYVALWIGDPTETGTGGAEASYTGYARVAVARTGAGWTVDGGSASNAAAIQFGEATGGTLGTITHAALMTAETGGMMLYRAPITPNIALAEGIAPEIPADGLTVTEE